MDDLFLVRVTNCGANLLEELKTILDRKTVTNTVVRDLGSLDVLHSEVRRAIGGGAFAVEGSYIFVFQLCQLLVLVGIPRCDGRRQDFECDGSFKLSIFCQINYTHQPRIDDSNYPIVIKVEARMKKRGATSESLVH